jgi:hypothetical protein
MTDKKPSFATPGMKGRRAPTIDLQATEVATAPSTGTAAEPDRAEASAPFEPGANPEAPHPAPEHAEAAAETAQPQRQPDAPAGAGGDDREQTTAMEGERLASEGQRPEQSFGGAAATEAPEAAASRPRPSRSASWLWALIGGGLAGGAAAAALAWAGLLAWHDPGSAARQARIGELEQQVRRFAAQPAPSAVEGNALAELRSRVAKLETSLAAPRPAGLDPAVANRLSAMEGEVKALGENVGALGRRSDEAVATAREARQRAQATAASVTQLTDRIGAGVVERADLEQVVSRVAALEAAAKSIQGELAKRQAAGADDRSGRLAIAALALKENVERGAPFATELAMLKALAPDSGSLPPLEPFAAAGVPSAGTLARQLSALIPALQQAADQPHDGGGFLDKLAGNAEKLVRIHPMTEAPGAAAGAIVARIEIDASHADIAGALSELAALPAPVRAPAEAWIKQVQTRGAAIDASRQLAADAVAGLSR